MGPPPGGMGGGMNGGMHDWGMMMPPQGDGMMQEGGIIGPMHELAAVTATE